MANLVTVIGKEVQAFQIGLYGYSVRKQTVIRIPELRHSVDVNLPLSRDSEGIFLGERAFPRRSYVAQQVSYSDGVDPSYSRFFIASGFVERINIEVLKTDIFKFMDQGDYALHVPGIRIADTLPVESQINAIGMLWGYNYDKEAAGLFLSLFHLENPEMAIAYRPYELAFAGLYQE